jgi:hypothetical protein
MRDLRLVQWVVVVVVVGGGDTLPSLNLSSGPFDAKHLRALLGYVVLSSLA